MKSNPEPRPTDREQPSGQLSYVKPRLRKIRLAAEETLDSGCKLAGTCDLPQYPNVTGAGS